VAWHQPYLTHVSAPMSDRPCDDRTVATPANGRFSDWVGSLDQDPADFGLTPVWTANITFSNTGTFSYPEADDSPSPTRYICPGAPILVARYRTVKRLRYQVGIANVQLPSATPSGIAQ
jgi:hypothetical protein